ncbi:MAG TPA: flagellar basal body-associated FliL family protein [Clostridiaceae bacterium]|nr:flagellar basal body-associated FliL family protein [Clostridiaceae bacterium]
MENKRSLITILVLVIAILSIALAISIGYIFTIADNPKAGDNIQSVNLETPPPSDNELSKMSLFEDQIFNLKNAQSGGMHIIKVGVEIQYFKKVKGIKDVDAKLDLHKGTIKELVGTYFQNKTLDDVMAEDAKQKAKQELTTQINELLSLNEKENKKIVYTIVFEEWFYQ